MTAHLFVLERDGQRRDVFVELSGSVTASDPERLDEPLGEFVRTRGLKLVERYLSHVGPPAIIKVDNASWRAVEREVSESSA
jgi:hypothetical protein